MLQQKPDLARGTDLIHFIPEPPIADELRRRASHYRSAGLYQQRCDPRLNIQAIDLPDRSVDVAVAKRWFSADIREGIRATAFELAESRAGGEETVHHGLIPCETIFLAQRPDS